MVLENNVTMLSKAEKKVLSLATKLSKVSVTPKNSKKRNKRNKNGNKTVSAPISIQRKNVTGKPVVKTNSNCVHVTHREYLRDINGSDVFSNFTLSVNPGIYTTFPWLSQMANLYESYKFKTLRFVYEPACPSTTQGSVMMAIDFDAADAPPSSKVQLMAYKHAVRTPAWERCMYSSDLSDLLKFGVQRYVRSGPKNGQDIKTYDIGNLQFSVANFTSPDSFVGELYVEYSVEFYTPQLNSSLPASAVQIRVPNQSTTITSAATYINAGAPLVTQNPNGTGYIANFTGTYILICTDAIQTVTVTIGTGSTLGTSALYQFGANTRYRQDLVAGNIVNLTFASSSANLTFIIYPFPSSFLN